jgi:flagellar biosynthetic protein FliR
MHTLIPAAAGELMLGLTFVLMMQLCFAALYLPGRLVDVQAGFGLATLIDPVSHTQTPLVGTMFAYAAGALFFSMGGHLELLRLLSMSLDTVPLGQWRMPGSLDHLLTFISAIFVVGLGVAGSAVLVLFLIDMAIALLARTVPQMNVLILGFQVKTIALLLALPVCFGIGGALMVRMIRMTLEAMPGLF